jgi:hypothetical protein
MILPLRIASFLRVAASYDITPKNRVIIPPIDLRVAARYYDAPENCVIIPPVDLRVPASYDITPENCVLTPIVDLRVFDNSDITSASLVVNENCEIASAPLFVAFHELVPVYELLNKLRLAGSFSIGGTKRAIKKTMSMHTRPTNVPSRPHAFDVVGMYNPVMYQGGATPLPKGDSPLNIAVMDCYHVFACNTCVSSVNPTCYWDGMRKPLTHGWVPPISIPSIVPLYTATGVDGNHRSASIFPATIQKELAEQVRLGICTPSPTAPTGVIVAPLGASLRSSDRMKAAAITGIMY